MLLLSFRKPHGSMAFLSRLAAARHSYYYSATIPSLQLSATPTTSSSSPSYLDNLNDAQIQAVTQPLESITRVVAGPGAGKTRVLTCRIAHLLQQTSQNNDRILAVTFTKKAAMEMQQRLETLLVVDNDESREEQQEEEDVYEDDGEDRQHHHQQASSMNRVSLGTFHSICAKILRRNGAQLATLPSIVENDMEGRPINLDGSFVIIDQSDQVRMLKAIAKDLEIDIQNNQQLKPMSILAVMSKIKAKTLGKKEYGVTVEAAKRIYPRYRRELLSTNSLDFDDLICLAAELLRVDPNVREILQRTWKHILVDEFQDTSQTQLDLVKSWTNTSLLVVGDADQSIYSWRGAHVESMADFGQEFPNVDTVYLMENYRSTTNIVNAAQRIISGSESVSAADLRQDMKPMRGKGKAPKVLSCANNKAEATYVVKTILGMVADGQITPQQTVAILYRTNAQSRSLEEACVQHNCPYVVRGNAGTFYNRVEIKDCLCFLRLLNNGRDQSALLRAFKTPSRGLGPKAVEEFELYCQRVEQAYVKQDEDNRPTPFDLLLALTDKSVELIPDLPSADAYLSKRALNNFKILSEQMRLIRRHAKKESVSELMKSVIEIVNLKDHFNSISKSKTEFEDRWNNVQELRNAAERYTEGGSALEPITANDDTLLEVTPIASFLDDIALITDMASENERDSQQTKANLMTIHAAKGMEFDFVFLVGNEEGTFPSIQAISDGGSNEMDEERRLCYVAMTRAKDQLFLTWRREVSRFTASGFRTEEKQRSRFLNVLIKDAKKEAGGDTKKQPNVKAHLASERKSASGASRSYSTQRRQRAPQRQQMNPISNNMPEPARRRGGSSSNNGSKGQRLSSSPTKKTVKRKPEQKMDSTWIFPVGSSVVHLRHGPGKVAKPPPDSKDGEMMVRVKFDSGNELDLPAMTRDLFPN